MQCIASQGKRVRGMLCVYMSLFRLQGNTPTAVARMRRGPYRANCLWLNDAIMSCAFLFRFYARWEGAGDATSPAGSNVFSLSISFALRYVALVHLFRSLVRAPGVIMLFFFLEK